MKKTRGETAIFVAGEVRRKKSSVCDVNKRLKEESCGQTELLFAQEHKRRLCVFL